MKSILINTLIASLLLSVVSVANAEIMLVIHPSNSLKKLTISHVKKIFLGKKKAVDGRTITPVDQSKGRSIREEFYKKYVGKSVSKLDKYWYKQIFTGKRRPPKIVGGDSDVINWVANHPSALGYVDSKSVNKSVKAFGLK